MRNIIQIQIDKHQFQLLKSMRNCQVVMIGGDFIHESDTVIFNEYDSRFDDITHNVCIKTGAFKTIQYTPIVGTIITFLIGYTLEGVRRPLGLSGVRIPDKIESF